MDFLLVNKNLIRTSKIAYVYLHESNVNSIHLIIPPISMGYDLKELKPYVEISVPNGIGFDINKMNIEYDEEPYKEGYLSLTVPVSSWMTKHEGTAGIRVLFNRIVRKDKEETILKSTTSSFDIIDSGDVSVIGYKPGGGEGSDESVYTVVQEDITDVNKAEKAIGKTSFNNGDVLVIKDDYGCAAGYQYDNNMWVAFSGNVSADNVIISEDILLAGSYTQVGNVTKEISETKTLESKGKTLSSILQTVFTKEEQPTKTNPSLSITYSQSGTKEVGTTISPTFSISFNEGSYTYDATTGVTFSNLKVTDTDGHSSTSKSGSFDSFVVLDNTNYKISATVDHSDGTIAKTNLGNDSNPAVQIKAGTLSKTSSATTGYRPIFYGLINHTNPLTSDDIRGLVNGGNYNAARTIEIKVGGKTDIKRIVVAIPKTNTRGGIVKVEKTDGLVTDITPTYVKQNTFIQVDDLRKTGSNMIDYTWWCYQPAKIDPQEIHSISMK